ncbi:MAG: mechanosensitive ion channel [Desulfobulbaceae bacterium]|nr:mechanosensitive ion channel [Desulfobulbaceae bacterium]
MLKKSFLTILLLAVLAFANAFLSQPACAADPVVAENNQESAPAVSPQSAIEEKLKKIQQLLADSRSEKTAALSRQLNIPEDKFQEKIVVLQEIEATYQRQLTALTKQASLGQELKNLSEQIDSNKGVLVSQLPPYSLTAYDLYLDQLDKMQQRENAASAAQQNDKKNLDDAHANVNAASQRLRQEVEKVEQEGTGDSPAQNMQITITRLKNEQSEATLDLNGFILENSKIELQIAQQQKNIARQQVDWVRSRLAFDEQDLQERLKLLDGLRQKLKTLMASLAAKQQEVEDTWLKAQQEYSDTGIDDELKKERSKSWLDARQSWRDTYQQLLEQTENSLRLISRGEQTWQRRYAMIKGEVNYDEFDQWEKETVESLDNINRLITMAQNSQNSLQPQITSVKMQLALQGFDPVIARNQRTMLEALDKLLEHTVEYLSRLQTMARFENRFLAEIQARQQSIKVTDILGKVATKFLNMLDYEVWVIDDQSVTVKKVIVALLILSIGLLLAKFISRFTTDRILLRTKLDESDRAIFDRILYILMLVLIVLFALHTVNIPLTALTFLGGAFAIGVGFGTQNLLNNFISGFIIMLERPVKIGDTIEFESTIGAIEEIGIRCTKIRTAGNVHILVPNSSLLEKNIVNWTLSDQVIRCQVRVGVAYGSEVREVSKLLYQAVAEHGKILKKPEPIVIFNDFGDSALIFDVYYWIRLGDNRMEKMIIESDVRFLIEKHLREGGISIPFPQRDIHLDTTQPLNLRILQDSGEPQAKDGVATHEQ